MGRKSLARERRAQLLEAFERCVGRYGLEGSSLERIAAEAGMRRNMLRHYFGNRDALVAALVERIVEEAREAFCHAIAGLPADDRLAALLDRLFGGGLARHPRDAALLDALRAASSRDTRARRQLLDLYQGFEGLAAAELRRLHPEATPERCRAVAYSLLCLALADASLVELGLDPSHHRDARSGAEAIVASLGFPGRWRVARLRRERSQS